MIASLDKRNCYAPGFKIELNGAELDPEAAHCVRGIKVEQALNSTNAFTMEIQDTFAGGRFRWLETDFFKVADTISVSLGYANGKTQLLEGKIQNLNASFESGCAPCLTVEGSDSAYEVLTAPSETRVFQGKRDSEIVREIAEDIARVRADIDDTQPTSVVKTKPGGKSYLDFIRWLATENQFTFFLGGRRLAFKQSATADPVATFTWGHDVVRFEPRLNTSGIFSEILVRGWDAKNKRVIEGRASSADEPSPEQGKHSGSEVSRTAYGGIVKVITERPVRSVEEARQIACGELNRVNGMLVRASLETIGTPELTPGQWVSVEGFGPLFSGRYFIVQTIHSVREDGYRTTLQIRRNAA